MLKQILILLIVFSSAIENTFAKSIKSQDYEKYKGYGSIDIGLDFYNKEYNSPYIKRNDSKTDCTFTNTTDVIHNKASLSPSISLGIFIKPRISIDVLGTFRSIMPQKEYKILTFTDSNKMYFIMVTVKHLLT